MSTPAVFSFKFVADDQGTVNISRVNGEVKTFQLTSGDNVLAFDTLSNHGKRIKFVITSTTTIHLNGLTTNMIGQTKTAIIAGQRIKDGVEYPKSIPNGVYNLTPMTIEYGQTGIVIVHPQIFKMSDSF